MIVRISGGIGNQMFQYAFKKSMDHFSGTTNFIDIRYYNNNIIHNGYELERVFNIIDKTYRGEIEPPSERHAILYRLYYKTGKRFVITKKYAMEVLIDYYAPFSHFSGENYYLDGYWQSEEYFDSIGNEIRSIFTFPDFTEKKNKALLELINNKNTIAMHIRRGDFLGNSKFVCLGNTNYYQDAVSYMKSHVESPVFIVLSDDIEWCKHQLNLNENCVYVDWNNGKNSFRDMQIMSLCKNCIIANSSFSWWGAWLNQSSGIVVAPSKFYAGSKRNEDHLLPHRWVKI